MINSTNTDKDDKKTYENNDINIIYSTNKKRNQLYSVQSNFSNIYSPEKFEILAKNP